MKKPQLHPPLQSFICSNVTQGDRRWIYKKIKVSLYYNMYIKLECYTLLRNGVKLKEQENKIRKENIY